MRILAFATAALVVMAAGAVVPQRAAWTFDDAGPGRLPAGFVFTDEAGGGTGGDWQVIRDGGGAVLAHAPQARAGAGLAVLDSPAPANVVVSARVRFPEAASAAGIAWRYRDRQNYNAVVLDLRAQNIRIYRVAGGNRARLEDEDDLELDPTAWHTLKVEDAGQRMRVWIDGVPVADARDRGRADAGAAGFWTAGDARVWFDDLLVEPVTAPPRPTRRD